jgi:hypothetical protein
MADSTPTSSAAPAERPRNGAAEQQGQQVDEQPDVEAGRQDASERQVFLVSASI